MSSSAARSNCLCVKDSGGRLKLVAIDLFAGAGGTTLGLRRAGFDVRLAVELDPAKALALAGNHPRTNVLGLPGTVGEVRKLAAADIATAAGLNGGSPDLVVGCPPCQGYSTQGKHRSDDARNYLYMEFVRLVEGLGPKAVVFENVPGMATLHDGRFLADLLERLGHIGYEPTVWHLKASELGVPQVRQRLFVAALAGTKPGRPPYRRRAVAVWDAIADLPAAPAKPRGEPSRPVRYSGSPRSAYAAALRGKRQTVTGCEVSRHSPSLVARFRRLEWGQADQPTWHRRLHPHQPAPTLTAGTRTRTACRPVHPYADRALTVREGARLASFPDWYKFPPQIAEAWSQIGNCVPPLMAEAVFRRVWVFLRRAAD